MASDKARAVGSPSPAPAAGVPALAIGAGALTLLDVTMINVAAPVIAGDLGLSGTATRLVLIAYTLSFAVVLVAAGRAGDVAGHHRLLRLGTVVFLAGAVVACLAPTAGVLVAGRVVQGVGAGILQPQVAAELLRLPAGGPRARAFGAYGAAVGAATGIGPVLAGLVVTVAPGAGGWRAVFVVEAAAALVLLALLARAARGRPAQPRGQRWGDVDAFGALLVGAAVVCALVPVVAPGEVVAGTWAWAGGALVLAAAAVGWERRRGRTGRPQAVPSGLVRQGGYRRGLLVAMVQFGATTGLLFAVSLGLQSGSGLDPLSAGLALTPFALGTVAAAALAGRLLPRRGGRVVAAGLAVGLAGAAALAGVSAAVPGTTLAWWTAAAMLVVGAGNGLVVTPNQTLALSIAPASHAGSAAGLLQSVQRLGSSLGILVVGAVQEQVLRSGTWQEALAAAVGVAGAGLLLVLPVALLAGRAGERPRGGGAARRGRSEHSEP
ncbi:MAG: MFS transporter [Kineosporiaceae bacterium]